MTVQIGQRLAAVGGIDDLPGIVLESVMKCDD
jgi:hypothetical protein